MSDNRLRARAAMARHLDDTDDAIVLDLKAVTT